VADEEDRPGGRERLLQAVVRHLATRSEADLRVTDIAREADVAVGLIRHHFGSREGLVTAAQQIRLEGAVKADLEAARSFLRTAQNEEEFLEGIRGLTVALLDPSRRAIRLARIAVLGSAHGRPEVEKAYAHTVQELVDGLTGIVVQSQASRFGRADLDPRAVATFIQAYALGMILHDLDPDATDAASMVDVIMTAVRSMIIGDGPASDDT